MEAVDHIIADDYSGYDEAGASEAVPAGIVAAEQKVQSVEQGDERCQLRVGLAGETVDCHDGIVRIPLELTLGSETRRLVVSIAIDTA